MSNTRVYHVSYVVDAYHDVYVERPVDITEDELLASITRDDLANGEPAGHGWDEVKDAWRKKAVSHILDEEGEEVVFSN